MSKNEVAIIPLAGFSPCSHMGHAVDLGILLDGLPGSKKFVGMSAKADVLHPDERMEIFDRQTTGRMSHWHLMVARTAGETIRAAFNEVAAEVNRTLHLVVGHDRIDYSIALRASILMDHHGLPRGAFSKVEIHHPSAVRQHSLSGTKMRQAAHDGDMETFRRHMGDMFSENELNGYMWVFQNAIRSGRLKIKR